MADREQAPQGTADAAVDAVLTASRLLVAISARSFAAVENTLTLPQFRMLVVLDRTDGMNISRLGEHLDVIPSTAMRMVDRLAGAGMVRRDPSSSNRREVLVNLTPENPYFADALQQWPQGYFLNFNGVTHLVSLAWPFAALFYLMLLAPRARAEGPDSPGTI